MVLENDTASYRLNTLLPTEHAGMVIANDTASYNLANILPATYNGLLIDNATKQWTLDNLLPEQKVLYMEQGNVQRAQTLHTRRNADASVQEIDSKSPINMQAVLHYGQFQAYVRDMLVKNTKLHSDVYAVMRTTDESIAPPGGLDAAAASTAAAQLAARMAQDVMGEWGNL